MEEWAIGRIAAVLAGFLIGAGNLAWGSAEPTSQPVAVQAPADTQTGRQAGKASRFQPYLPQRTESGVRATNPRQGFQVRFGPSGVTLANGKGAWGESRLSLSLAAFGRAGQVTSVGPANVRVVGNEVRLDRPGIIEWYINDSRGLEQGFDIPRRPKGDGPLRLEVAVSGATPELGGDGVVLTTSAGEALRYGHLIAVDSRGRRLPAELGVAESGRLVLTVNDRQARYPVIVDPLLTAEHDRILQGDNAGAQMGASVASAGDIDGNGVDDVVIGAPRYTNEAGEEVGAVYVYLGQRQGGLPEQPSMILEGSEEGARFGSSVAGAGDLNSDNFHELIIGAKWQTGPNGAAMQGAAFIFEGCEQPSSDCLSAIKDPESQADTVIRGEGAYSILGFSVAGNGDVNGDGHADILIGAIEATEFGEEVVQGGGSAYLFLGTGSGLAAGLSASDADARVTSAQPKALLGYSVAFAGDLKGDGEGTVDVAIGAPGSGSEQAGKVLVFFGGPGLTGHMDETDADVPISAQEADTWLGVGVGTAGDVDGDGWDDLLAGAGLYDGGETDEGAAFLFTGKGLEALAGQGATLANADAVLEADKAEAQMGSVTSAGDVDGDGYSDVLIGAPWYSDGGDKAKEGAAFLFMGSAQGIASGNPNGANAVYLSGQKEAELGSSVAIAGDVNGDGRLDVLAGARGYDEGQTDEGATFLFLGGKRADLALGKNGPFNGPVTPGDRVILTLRTLNNGPNDVASPSLNLRLPDGLRLVDGGDGSLTCKSQGARKRCGLGQLASGAEPTVDVVLEATATGAQTLDASLKAAQAIDPDPTNNKVVAGVTVIDTGTSSNERSDSTASGCSIGGGGCSVRQGSPVDPLFPALLGMAGLWLAYRRWAVG